jgi:hypothetical protein
LAFAASSLIDRIIDQLVKETMMDKKCIKLPSPLYFVVSLALLLSACIGTTQQNSQPEQRNYPTVFITPLVTQIIATRSAPTPTPQEESTPTQIIAASYDPLKVKAYYPITGCVASRLRVGDSAFVAYNGGQMGVYTSKDITFAPLLRNAETGESFLITDGPWCDEKTIVWKVRTMNEEDSVEDAGGWAWEIENYVPEGNGDQYWLLPLESNPGIPTPKPTQQRLMYYVKLHFPGCGRR